MLFSSPVFITLFLPLVLVINMFLNHKFRNIWLLIASVFFYLWGEGTYVIVMLCSICFNYIWGIWIEHSLNSSKSKAQLVFAAAILFNITILMYFKYFNFILDNLKNMGVLEGLDCSQIHLPLGISFFTFENISYCFDVYRRENKAQKSLFNYGLFITIFPHLIAGPIVKYHSLASQIEKRTISSLDYKKGIFRFSLGLFKKMFIANNLAFIADKVFDQDVSNLTSVSAWIAILAYSLQLYFDFSGYSDMAIGLAKLFGFDLMENFNHPYVAVSIQDFWRRWHISLSTWFREYLYIPLGGNRGGKLATYRNLFVVFLCTGIWHGASWNFVIWGLFHGTFIIIERIGLQRLLMKAWRPISHLYTLIIILVGWTFFRIENLKDATEFLPKLFGIGSGNDNLILSFMDNFHVFIFLLAIVLSTPVYNKLLDLWIQLKARYRNNQLSLLYGFTENAFQLAFLIFSLFISYMEIATNSYNPFIYFRF